MEPPARIKPANPNGAITIRNQEQQTNNMSRMKLSKTIRALLACLAGTCFIGSQANAGTLSASVAPTPTTIDLTAEGALDWARWGGGNYIPDDPAAYNHKAGVTPLISTYTLVGPDAATSAEQWNDAGTPLFTWSDGTPTLTGDGLGNGGSYFPNTGNSTNGLGDGYQITVPASTTPQILKVFTGCYSALVNFNAALSDNSAPPYDDQSMNDQTGNGFNGVYTIIFAAGSAGQTLTVTITMTNVNAVDRNSANLTLEAATLAGPAPLIITQPAPQTNFLGLASQFSVAASGVPPFSYQWWKEAAGVYVPLADGGQISGSKSNTLTISDLTISNGTNYSVVVTNVYGAVTSSVASLTILPLGIISEPVSSTNWVGQNRQLSVSAVGASLAYEWYAEANGVYVPLADGGQISGSRSNTLTITNLEIANGTNYYVVVTNGYGAVTSSVATLTVLPITGALIGSALPAPATVDLTALGTLDWAHWGLNLATDFDQKAGGTNQISNFTVHGDPTSGPNQYPNALAAYSWTDGTPDPTAANTTTGVYFNGLDNGYQITVPSDQTKRILTIYAGGWTTTVHFEAVLSDLSAPSYVDESLVAPSGASRMAAYTIKYAAGSPGQTLTINVYCATDGGNVTLMAATLYGPQPLILTQPDSSTNWVGQDQQFSVIAGGWPTLGYQWWQEANGVYAPLADGGQISGSKTPTLTINNLVFANGTNYFAVVTNAYGSVTSSVANLTVLPPLGTMQGGVDTNIASLTVVDLTAEGTLDWANWGLTAVSDFNDKAVGGVPVGLISNWTVYGPIGYGPDLDNFSDQPYGFSWTNGTPTATASTTGHGTANYVYVGSLGAGFQITVPADTTKKVLKLYYGGWECRTRVMAMLSDNSAPPLINDSVDDPAGNVAYGVATIYFAAASAGQTLTVTVYDVVDYQGGNVAISAATLARPAPINVTFSKSGSSLQLNWLYGTLLQATNVTGPWTVNGNALPPSYTITPTGPHMFYRVQVQ